MNVKKFGLASLVGLLSVLIAAAAAQALVFVPAQVAPSGAAISVPDIAVNKSPALENLEPGILERIVFIHYANGKVVANAKAPTCYKLLGV